MRSKNFITKCLLCGLALLTVFSLAGCKEEDIPQSYEEKPFYEQQYKNVRYYCQQGYPNDWTIRSGESEYYLKEITTYADGSPTSFNDCGLVAQLSPTADSSKVKYSVYSLKGTFMRATPGDILIGLLGKNTYNFEFNNLFLFLDGEEQTPRDAFVWETDVEDTPESIDATTVSYNRINFQRVAYTFTVHGVDWKGMMLSTIGKEGFYVITLESETSSWDSYYATMETMLKDFRLLGWETEE